MNIRITSGGAVLPEPSGYPSGTAGAAFSYNCAGETNATLYLINAFTDELQRIDRGAAKVVGKLGVDTGGFVGFDIGRDGRAWATVTPDGPVAAKLYSVDLTIGTVALIGVTGPYSLRGFALAAVPEPRTGYLLALGLGAMGLAFSRIRLRCE